MADASSGRFDIGRVISEILSVVRGTAPTVWPVLAGFILAPQVVVALIELAILPSRVDRFINPGSFPLATPMIMGPIFLLALLSGLLALTGSIALTYSSANFLNGKTTTPAEAVGRAVQLFLPVLGAIILVAVGTGVGFLLLIIPGLFLAVVWSVVLPVRIMEPISAYDALGRSYRLTSSFRWPIVGVYLIMMCAYFVFALVFGVLTGILGLIGLRLVVTVILSPLFLSVISLIGAALPASIYHELLRIKEGGGSSVAEVFS